MPRRYYRKSVKAVGKSNWSHENKGCLVTTTSETQNTLYQGGAIVVPASSSQGIRTVGNLTITVPSPYAVSAGSEIYWAIVYVPQGTTAGYLFNTTQSTEGSLYEPNQYVMASGITDPSAGPIRVRSRIMRKLHSGDFISLIIGGTTAPSSNSVRALVSYSVKYN